MTSKKMKKKAKAAQGAAPKVKSKSILKRKQLRMEKRKAKKNSKVEFFKNKYSKNKGRIPLDDQNDEEIPSSEDEMTPDVKTMTKKTSKAKNTKSAVEINKKTEKELKELKRQQKKQRNKQLKLANEEEKDTIARLEKQLGLKKRKSKNLPKSFEEDGLSYILDACDPTKLESMGAEFSEDEDEGKFKKIKFDDSSDEEEDDDQELDELLGISEGLGEGDESDDVDDDGNEDTGDGGDELKSDGSNDEMDHSGSDSEENDHVNNDYLSGEEEEEAETKPDVWEDIYGRTRDSKGNILLTAEKGEEMSETVTTQSEVKSKYVPPALRKKALEMNQSEEKRLELARLSKQMKGLLNRLAETNMAGIAKQLEGFYREHSRNDVNQTLTDLITSSLTGPSLTPSRLVMEHVMLVAILHANVGTEVGAHVLQSLVKIFSSTYSVTDLATEETKVLDNFLLLISYMHAFKVVNSKLVFDILDQMTDSFKAKDIELIMVVLKNCGFVLRKEDPVELKNLIVKIQSQASQCQEDDSRVMFMLEVLLAIKNNNVNKIPNYDPTHFDHLKKTLRSYLREGNFVTEMKIGFKDLVQAESRGRWWIVGSAFMGDLAGGDMVEEKGEENLKKSDQQFSSKLLDLARKMRMNTDTRRQIFCLLMTAEDYMDATEKLVKLGTKNQTERDVTFVLTDCCVQEKEFNPYYAHLATKLAKIDRKYRLATQFTIWDKLKQIAELKKFQQSNLAKFTAFLIMDKTQSLGVLKVIEFAEMNKHNVRFLREVLISILLPTKEDEVKDTFKAVSESSNLALFRESLRLFMHHFLLKQSNKLPPETNLTLLMERVKVAETALMFGSSKLQF